MIALALRLHETTINRHISDYLNDHKLKPENGGQEAHFYYQLHMSTTGYP